MKKREDLISVIIPVYNVENYIERCVQSITNQTYKNLEIILVDDGSTDNSGMVCEQLKENDSRIIVVHQRNQGLGPARNSGIEIMHGQYVAFVDSDDWIELNMYETMYSAMKKYNCEVVTCGRKVVSDKGVIEKIYCNRDEKVICDEEIIREYLLQKNMNMSACDKLFKADLFNNIRFPGDFIVSEDIVPIYRILDQAHMVCMTGKPLYNYYYRLGSLSKGNFSERTMGTYKYAEEVSDYVKEKYEILSVEADYYKYDGLISVYRKLRGSSYTGTLQREIYNILKMDFCNIFRNKYLYKRQKVYVLLSIFHMDKLLDKIYCELKQRTMRGNIKNEK